MSDIEPAIAVVKFTKDTELDHVESTLTRIEQQWNRRAELQLDEGRILVRDTDYELPDD